jgi:hypothetical protein
VAVADEVGVDAGPGLDEQQVSEPAAERPATAAAEVDKAPAVVQPGAAGAVLQGGELGVQAGGVGQDEEQPAGTLVDLAGSGGEGGGSLLEVRAGGVGVPERFPVGEGNVGLVPGDGMLDSADQQRRLGADGQVHGLCGDAGGPGDAGDRGARPPVLGERAGRGLQDPPTGLRSPGQDQLPVSRRAAPRGGAEGRPERADLCSMQRWCPLAGRRNIRRRTSAG